MVNFEFYLFKDTGYGLTHLPENTHLINETTLYLYYVSADNNKELWKYTKSLGTDEKVEDRTQDIKALWNDDVDGTHIWGVDCDNPGNDFDVWKLLIADDSVTEIGTSSGADAGTEYAFDILKIGAEYFVHNEREVAGDGEIATYNVTEAPFVREHRDRIWTIPHDWSYGFVTGTKYYIYFEGSGNIQYLVYDDSTTQFAIWGFAPTQDRTGTIPANKDLRAPASASNDIVYNVFTTGGNNYLYTHVIVDGVNDLLTRGAEYDVALMLDRNSIQTAGSPWAIEKAFHISTSDVYRITTEKDYLLKIQNLGLTGGVTIKAITDKYLVDSDKNVYLYAETIADMHTARASYQTHRVPKGRFSHASEFSTDQLIEIWTSVPELVFRGKMGTPRYDQRRALWNYSINNMGYDDLQERISYDAVGEGIDNVVLALFGQLTNPYLYADATSVPNIAINMTYKFDRERFKDTLFVCMILGNAYPWYEPNGYSYFRAYGNSPASGDTYSNAVGNMGNPKVNKHQAQFNDFSNIRGGMDLANGRPFEPTPGTETIAEHVQQYGKKLWKGRWLFSGALTQASLDAIVAGLKAWQGMVSNPIDASFKVKQYYYPVGYDGSVQFTLNNLIPDAIDMIFVGVLINFKKPNLIDLATSTNIVRRR